MSNRHPNTSDRHVGRRFGALAVLVALLLAGLGLLAPTPAGAEPGPPFTCESSTIFISQGFGGTMDGESQLYQMAYGSGSTSFEAVGPPRDVVYNGMAFNPADGYLYAVGTHSRPDEFNRLYQIDRTGAVTDLGVIRGLPSELIAQHTMIAGVFGEDGEYYVSQSQPAPVVYRVNVVTQASTPIHLDQPVFVADWAASDGYLWGVHATDASVWYRVDVSTGSVTTIANTTLPTSDVWYGAAWSYGNGNLGFSSNASGWVYEVAVTDPHSASPTFRVVSAVRGPVSNRNDGAVCIAALPVDLSAEKTGPAVVEPGGPISWTVRVTNHGPGISSGHSLTDVVSTAGVTGLDSPDEACRPLDDATVQCVSGQLQPGESVTYTITGVAPAEPGTVHNDATVVGHELDPNPDNDHDDHELVVDETEIPLVSSLPAAAAGVGVLGAVLLLARRRRSAVAA